MAKQALAKVQGRFQPVKMGLGDAVKRLIAVEWTFRSGAGGLPEQLLDEREMLLEALNVIPVDVGFDCNSDGVPDTVEIFEQAVSTSCCRLMPPTLPKPKPASRRKAPPKKRASKKTILKG